MEKFSDKLFNSRKLVKQYRIFLYIKPIHTYLLFELDFELI